MPKHIPPFSARPTELIDYEHDVRWTREGQKVAKQMAEYIFEALMIPRCRRPQIPRIIAYAAKIEGDQILAAGPIRHGDAAYYYPTQNFIALQSPIPGRSKCLKITEYPFIAKSKIIGALEGTPWDVFLTDLCHEMAHWVVERIFRDSRCAPHGRKWRIAYALLRERFVNRPHKRLQPK